MKSAGVPQMEKPSQSYLERLRAAKMGSGVRSFSYQQIAPEFPDITADIEALPLPSARSAAAAVEKVPSKGRPSFFCECSFLCYAVPVTVLSSFFALVLLPLWVPLLGSLVFLYLYMSHFMPLHDWAEKVPVLLIKFFNFERTFWPAPSFNKMVTSPGSCCGDGCACTCCKKATGEIYVMQPKGVLEKADTDYSIGVSMPVLEEAEYINLRSMRFGLSCCWADLGAKVSQPAPLGRIPDGPSNPSSIQPIHERCARGAHTNPPLPPMSGHKVTALTRSRAAAVRKGNIDRAWTDGQPAKHDLAAGRLLAQVRRQDQIQAGGEPHRVHHGHHRRLLSELSGRLDRQVVG